MPINTLFRQAGPGVFTLTDAATILVDYNNGGDQRVTLGGNRTLGNPSNPVDGREILFAVTQDGTGSRTLSYGTAYEFSSSLPSPTLSTTPAFTDILKFRYYASKSKWLFIGFVNGFA